MSHANINLLIIKDSHLTAECIHANPFAGMQKKEKKENS
jgi:hypothetical protein